MTTPIKGEEHWTSKDGGVKLFLFEKCAGDPAKTIGTILFVHGSSMAVAADLRSAGAGTARTPRRWITSPAAATTAGASTWKVTGARPRTATTTRRSAKAPTIATPPRSISRSCAANARSSSTAFHPARCARRCLPSGIRRWWRGSRSTPWCGPAKARPRSPAAQEAARVHGQEPAPDRQGLHPFDLRRATIPAPPRKR